MTQTRSRDYPDWQLRHYASAGTKYGEHHFTRPDNPYTEWILAKIASVYPNAGTIAEVGAGTCIFSSLLGRKLQLETPVVCYEPVKELLEGSADFENVEAICGDAVDFARSPLNERFDLVFTKDTAHHFPSDALDEIHDGIRCKLKPEGRYLMVVRTPPRGRSVPVGSIARARWEQVYTPLSDLLASMRRISAWTEIEVGRWQLAVETDVQDWIDGVKRQDSWSIFSALDSDEIAATVEELEAKFDGMKSFDFLHQYDIAVFEKNRIPTKDISTFQRPRNSFVVSVRPRPMQMTRIDPTSPFTVEDANVGIWIANQPLPTKRLLCAAITDSIR